MIQIDIEQKTKLPIEEVVEDFKFYSGLVNKYVPDAPISIKLTATKILLESKHGKK